MQTIQIRRPRSICFSSTREVNVFANKRTRLANIRPHDRHCLRFACSAETFAAAALQPFDGYETARPDEIEFERNAERWRFDAPKSRFYSFSQHSALGPIHDSV